MIALNEQMTVQINDLQNKNKQCEEQGRNYDDQIKKLKAQILDDRQNMSHLQIQANNCKKERDDAIKLLNKMQHENEASILKTKQKHKDELEHLSNGFLQSLGASPGKDAYTVIKELKDNNTNLTKQVDLLAETLARKEKSLFEALKAVDEVLQHSDHKKALTITIDGNNISNISQNNNKIITPQSKDGSNNENINNTNNNNNNADTNRINNHKINNNNLNDKQSMQRRKSPLPRPSVHRSSQIYTAHGSKDDQFGSNAMFFKNAMSTYHNFQNEHSTNQNLDTSSMQTKSLTQTESSNRKTTTVVVNKQETNNSLMDNSNLADHVISQQKQLHDDSHHSYNKHNNFNGNHINNNHHDHDHQDHHNHKNNNNRGVSNTTSFASSSGSNLVVPSTSNH